MGGGVPKNLRWEGVTIFLSFCGVGGVGEFFDIFIFDDLPHYYLA